MGLWKISLFVILLTSPLTFGQYDEESLQDAVDIIARRRGNLDDSDDDYAQYRDMQIDPQQDLAFLAGAGEYGGDGQPENIGYGYQKALANEGGIFIPAPEGGSNYPILGDGENSDVIIDYMDEDDMSLPQQSVFRERGKKSVFRERLQKEHDAKLQRKILSDPMGRKFQEHNYRGQRVKNIEDEENEQYLGYLDNIWEKYKNDNPNINGLEDLSDSDIKGIIGYIKDNDSQKKSNSHSEVAKRDYDFFNNQDAFGGLNSYQMKKRKAQKSDGNPAYRERYRYSLETMQPDGSRDYIDSPMDDQVYMLSDRDNDAALMVGKIDNQEWPSNEQINLQNQIPYNTDRPVSHVYKKNERVFRTRGKYLPPLVERKRLVVTKRSPKVYLPANAHAEDSTGHYRRLTKKRETLKFNATDPKVAKELSQIFSSSDESPDKNTKDTISKTQFSANGGMIVKAKVLSRPNVRVMIKKNDKKFEETNDNMYEESEDENEIPNEADVPLEIQKKSVDWSDYFGIDRRKRKMSGNEHDIDHDWLWNQYYKTMDASKASPNPSEINRNRGADKKWSSGTEMVPQSSKKVVLAKRMNKRVPISMKGSDAESFDEKIRDYEDVIMDNALKYTGSHEGAVDSNEIEEVKNKVINDLITINNLEKLRQAVREKKFKAENRMHHNYAPAKSDRHVDQNIKEKRYTLVKVKPSDNGQQRKRKQYNEKVNEELVEEILEELPAGNEPFSEGLMEPVDEEDIPLDDCSPLEQILKRCRGVDFLIGDDETVLLPLCVLHQICYSCGPKVGSPSESACDIMYLAEADSQCKGSSVCKEVAHRSVSTLKRLAMKYPVGCTSMSCAAEYFHDVDEK